jgi:23S rRNA (pseudouridine1915-N3)-methyltransferase
MRLWLAAVGKLRPGPLHDLYGEYAKRIVPAIHLKEVEVRQRLPDAVLAPREGELLLEAVPPTATIVVLDERGTELPSSNFAAKIAAWRDGGVSDLAFLIGGASGHGDVVRARAGFVLSLGRMTWPHMLARVMLAEQLYRAQQILAGHPYHRP